MEKDKEKFEYQVGKKYIAVSTDGTLGAAYQIMGITENGQIYIEWLNVSLYENKNSWTAEEYPDDIELTPLLEELL